MLGRSISPKSSSNNRPKSSPKKPQRRRLQINLKVFHISTAGTEPKVKSRGALLVNIDRAQTVRKYWSLFNSHDLEGCAEFLTNDCEVVLEDDCELPWHEMKIEFEGLFQSFPDIRFPYQKLEVKDNGMIIIQEMVASGTHTGKPFACFACESIQASGKSVQNDPESITFHFRDDKICKIVGKGEGAIGPAGIYTQIGGFPLV
ncbi:expressed unknown protein [Seminavis robusta]|uniref:SnoaL-like domain-containing protein n=1 Tax=Seminavis robusta TaxID=568900 RepID=A0A9N8DLU5_9STRA|nr:expressed unknown protein [Seminavis robusta]|eukprot:Sro231_g093590.1 n/a (203) ;mRNA; f:38815-39423